MEEVTELQWPATLRKMSLDFVLQPREHPQAWFPKEIGGTGENPRRRKRFTRRETAYLVEIFEMLPFPSRHDALEVAEQLGVDYRKVQVWFQNRRARFKIKRKRV